MEPRRAEYGDPREKMPCPIDDVQMIGCDGVEGAGVDRVLPHGLTPTASNIVLVPRQAGVGP
jgi:hypothetical protein